MIDLSYKPHESGVLIDRLPQLITQAAAGNFEEQSKALKELRHIQRIGIESLEFVSTHREFWLVEKANDWGTYDDEFNALSVFLSAVTKSVSDTIALVEQDSDYDGQSFFDSSINRQKLAEVSAAATQQQAEAAQLADVSESYDELPEKDKAAVDSLISSLHNARLNSPSRISPT